MFRYLQHSTLLHHQDQHTFASPLLTSTSQTRPLLSLISLRRTHRQCMLCHKDEDLCIGLLNGSLACPSTTRVETGDMCKNNLQQLVCVTPYPQIQYIHGSVE